jgi:hypothetical protein
MANQVIRGRAATAPAVSEPIPIGQEEHEIFNCPVCARPLAMGSGRCPGCQTRLVRGVPASKAGLFVVSGLVVGLLVGAGGAAGVVAMNGALSSPSTAGQVTPSTVPAGTGGSGGNGSTGGSGSTGGGTTGTVYVSGIVSSSLRQAADLNVKLAEASTALSAQLDRSTLDTEETAMILRSIASNAQFGSEVAPRIGTWDAGSELSIDLAAFYESVRETARDGLAISLTSNRGYRQAATDMVRTLRQMRGLQATASKLAATANIQLPALPATP